MNRMRSLIASVLIVMIGHVVYATEEERSSLPEKQGVSVTKRVLPSLFHALNITDMYFQLRGKIQDIGHRPLHTPSQLIRVDHGIHFGITGM